MRDLELSSNALKPLTIWLAVVEAQFTITTVDQDEEDTILDLMKAVCILRYQFVIFTLAGTSLRLCFSASYTVWMLIRIMFS